MKKRITHLATLLLALVLLCAVAKPMTTHAASGTCGENLTWSVSSNTLTISGTGDMTNYTSGSNAPWKDSSITTVVISSGVTSVGNYAFADMSGITSVTMPSTLRTIGSNAFKNCTKLAAVTIPNTVQTFGSSAFSGCTALTSVKLPVMISRIESYLFSGCTGLTTVSIPSRVTVIGYSAFYGCNNLKTVKYSGAADSWSKITLTQNNDAITNAEILYASSGAEVPPQEVLIDSALYPESAHNYANNLNETQTFTWPGAEKLVLTFDAQTEVENNYDFLYLYDGNQTQIAKYTGKPAAGTTVTVPGDTVHIKLTSDSSVSKYGYAFASIVAHIPAPSYTYGGTCGDGVNWGLNDDGVLTIYGNGTMMGYSSSSGIYAPWYSYRSQITKLVVEEGVLGIGSYTFYYCYNLQEVSFPDSLLYIDYYAFDYCEKIASVSFPENLLSLGSAAFRGCSALRSIELPALITEIPNWAFQDCKSLKTVTIPNTVTSIGNSAFYRCSSLTDVYYNDTRAKWAEISIYNYGNDPLTGAALHATDSPTFQISIHTMPTKTEYWTGEALDTTGLVLSLNYTDGTTETVTSGFTASGYDPTRLGKQTVTVNYQGQTANFQVDTGIKGSVSSGLTWTLRSGTLTISGNGRLSCYSGMGAWEAYSSYIGTVIFEEGVTGIGASAFDEYFGATVVQIPTTVTEIGDRAFYGCYNLRNVYYNGSAAQWAKISIGSSNENLLNATLHTVEPTLTDLSILTLPEKTVYEVGESQNFAGLTLSAVYSDGSSVTVESGYQISGFDTQTIGTKTITIVYESVSLSFEVQVVCTNHSFTQYSYNNDATCTADGTKTATCDHCNATSTLVAAGTALGHDWKAATCTLPQTCARCGETEGDPLGHDWQDATCLLPKTCARCSETEGDPLGHDWKAATCTLPQTCARCGETEGDPLGHDWQDATCLLPQTCARCGETEGDPLGHTGDRWICLLAPTCTAQGLQARICTRCNITETAPMAAIDHSYQAAVTLPTCITQGYTTHTCIHCGDSYRDSYVEALAPAAGHSWSSWVQLVPATCTTQGKQLRFCNCGVTETQLTPTTAHNYENGSCTVCTAPTYQWTLQENTQVNVSLAEDLYVDLNGYQLSGIIRTNGYRIYGMDSATNSYSCDTMGYFTCLDENGAPVVPEAFYTAQQNMRYMTIATEEGYTFHRYELVITHISLLPATISFGYKAEFHGDVLVQAQVVSQSYSLWLTEDIVVTRSQPGFRPTMTLRLVNFDVENYGEAPVYSKVSMTLADGTVLDSVIEAWSLRQMVELVNETPQELTETQLADIQTMILQHPIMTNWETGNIFESPEIVRPVLEAPKSKKKNLL